MSSPYTHLADREATKNALTTAHEMFVACPNAMHWQTLSIAMLAYQQAHQKRGCPELIVDVRELTYDEIENRYNRYILCHAD